MVKVCSKCNLYFVTGERDEICKVCKRLHSRDIGLESTIDREHIDRVCSRCGGSFALYTHADSEDTMCLYCMNIEESNKGNIFDRDIG